MSTSSSTGSGISRRRLVGYGLGLAASSLLAACSAPAAGSPTAAPAPTTAPKPNTNAGATTAPTSAPAKPAASPAATVAPTQRTLRKFRYATPLPQFTSSYYFVGSDLGYFEKAGLDVELVPFDSDAIALKALIAGELDLLDANAASALVSISEGSNALIVGAGWKKVQFLLYARKDINDVGDLIGKNVATSAPNALPQVLVIAVMREAGLDPSKVTFVPVGAPGLVPALLGGKVDASSAAVDFLPQVEANPEYHAVFAYKDRLPNFVRGSFIINRERLQTKRDDLVTFMTEATRALRYEYDPANRDFVIQSLIKHVSYSQEQAALSLKWFTENKISDGNCYVSPEELTYMQQLNTVVGTQDKVLPPDQVATWDLQKQVIATLGEFKI